MKEELFQDLEQQKIFLKEINSILKKENQEYKSKISNLTTINTFDQQEQEHLITQRRVINGFQSRYKIPLLCIVVFAGLTSFMLYQENQLLINSASHLVGNYDSSYVIQNLQGDTVNTWLAWHLVSGQVLHVDVINEVGLSPDKIFAIKDSILSTQTVTLDDSLLHKGLPGTSSVYYKGWAGALSAASAQTTQFYIPEKFDVSDSPNGAGQIIIKLTRDENPDGLSGYTKSLVDNNEILKTTITIYKADQLSANQIGIIIRHEFGHAMGLAHSSDPEDLMHATIQTDYPYISGCDINAVTALYDGKQSSQVVCQK